MQRRVLIAVGAFVACLLLAAFSKVVLDTPGLSIVVGILGLGGSIAYVAAPYMSVRAGVFTGWAALLLVIAGFLVGNTGSTVIGRIVSDLYDSFTDEPSISAQLGDIRAEEANKGFYTAVARSAQLRGTGAESWVLVFRDYPESPRGSLLPDIVQIYEVSGGRLESRFRFRGSNTQQFRLDSIVDLDGDGDSEVLGSWNDVDLDRVPVVIGWDDIDTKYRIFPLFPTVLPTMTNLAAPPSENLERPEFRPRSRHYLERVLLRDDEAGIELEAYRVSDYFIARKGPTPIIVGSFKIGESPDRSLLEAWTLVSDGGRPVAFYCPESPVVVFSIPQHGSLTEAMRAAWGREKYRFECE